MDRRAFKALLTERAYPVASVRARGTFARAFLYREMHGGNILESVGDVVRVISTRDDAERVVCVIGVEELTG